MTRNREQTIEIVTQSMCNLALRTDGISIAFEDDGYDCIATFKCIYICGIEHIVCGIEDVGMVDII